MSVVCPDVGGGLSLCRRLAVFMSVVVCPGVGGGLSWCWWWPALGSVVVCPGVGGGSCRCVAAAESGSYVTVFGRRRQRPPLQPSDDDISPI